MAPFPAATAGANAESFVIEVTASRKAKIEAIRHGINETGGEGVSCWKPMMWTR